MAGIPGDIVAISASVYAIGLRRFDDSPLVPAGVAPALGNLVRTSETLESRTVTELPSSVMFFKHFGAPEDRVRHVLGMSLTIPRARKVEVIGALSGSLPRYAGSLKENLSVSVSGSDYYLGPSYAVSIVDRVRLGLSLFAQYSHASSAIESSTRVDVGSGSTGVYFQGQNSTTQDALGLTAVLGAQVRLVSKLWLGLGFELPSLPLGGRSVFNADASSLSADAATGRPKIGTSSSSLDGAHERATPLRLVAGLAWDDRERFSIAVDACYRAGRDAATSTTGVQSYLATRSADVARSYRTRYESSTDRTAAIDVAVGAEVAFAKVLALRLGGFTDFADTYELTTSLDDAYQLRMNRFGGTLGLGLTLGSFDSTLGVVYVHGIGKFGAPDASSAKAQQSGQPLNVPVGTTEDAVMLVLSGAVTWNKAKETIREALPIKTDLPARLIPESRPQESPPPVSPEHSSLLA
jgi:hypothetical protein